MPYWWLLGIVALVAGIALFARSYGGEDIRDETEKEAATRHLIEHIRSFVSAEEVMGFVSDWQVSGPAADALVAKAKELRISAIEWARLLGSINNCSPQSLATAERMAVGYPQDAA